MDRRTNFRVLSVLICLCFAFMTGCQDASEVDDHVYAIVLGIDRGTNNKIIVTIQYPTYKGGGGGESGGGSETTNIQSFEAPGVIPSMDYMNMVISRKIQLTHIRMVVVSEELAKEDIATYIAPLLRYRETRTTAIIVISNGTASDFIKENTATIGGSLSKTLELMFSQSRNTGLFPFVNFNNFYRALTTPYGDPIAAYAGNNDMKNLEFNKTDQPSPLVEEPEFLPGELPRSDTQKREFVGTAVFSGSKMIGSLNSSETRFMNMVIGEFRRGAFVISDARSPQKGIALSLRPGRKPEIKGRIVNGVPVIDVKLTIEADIGGIQSRIQYERQEFIEDLNAQIKKHLEKGINQLIDKTQTELKADVFEFGRYMAGSFKTIQDFETYNWLSHYPDAKINVKVDVNVRRTGLMIRSSPIYTPNGK